MGKGIALFIGLISLTIGLSLVYYRVSKIKAGIITNATVVSVESKKDGTDMLYRPVLRFINYRNEPMIYKPSFRAPDWYTGETVRVLYTKDHYDYVSILTYWRAFGFALLFLCSASVFLLITGGEYLAGRFFKTLNTPYPIN